MFRIHNYFCFLLLFSCGGGEQSQLQHPSTDNSMNSLGNQNEIQKNLTKEIPTTKTDIPSPSVPNCFDGFVSVNGKCQKIGSGNPVKVHYDGNKRVVTVFPVIQIGKCWDGGPNSKTIDCGLEVKRYRTHHQQDMLFNKSRLMGFSFPESSGLGGVDFMTYAYKLNYDIAFGITGVNFINHPETPLPPKVLDPSWSCPPRIDNLIPPNKFGKMYIQPKKIIRVGIIYDENNEFLAEVVLTDYVFDYEFITGDSCEAINFNQAQGFIRL